MTIKQMKSDEKATIERVVEGQVVSIKHSVKPDRESPVRYNLNWAFDFTNVKPAELLLLASRAVLITQQAEWRKAKNKMDEKSWDNVTFGVRGMLDEVKKTADPLTRAKNLAQKMTAAERTELMKALQEAK